MCNNYYLVPGYPRISQDFFIPGYPRTSWDIVRTNVLGYPGCSTRKSQDFFPGFPRISWEVPFQYRPYFSWDILGLIPRNSWDILGYLSQDISGNPRKVPRFPRSFSQGKLLNAFVFVFVIKSMHSDKRKTSMLHFDLPKTHF